MRYHGSGISFFTMSTGMADTYRSAVMDSPFSRLYCLQGPGAGALQADQPTLWNGQEMWVSQGVRVQAIIS
jgi:hypothetical protein